MVYIKLKGYLKDLEESEIGKPKDERRYTPSISDIARDTNIHYTSLNRMVNYHTKRLDFETADKIIKSVRKYGFDMQISDLIIFRDEEEA